MTKTYFTSDWHIGHKNIIKICNRPYKNIDEMNESIIYNFNSIVKKNDLVYFAGDMAFGKYNLIKTLNKINGVIHFIIGNHDIKYLEILKDNCATVNQIKDIKINNQKITICHYAMKTWNCSHYGSWQLYGHSHGNLITNNLQYDVGIDNNNFKPISFNEIKKIIINKNKEYNK